jgi:tRNA(Ile)-lysidine synthase TilS/MesJ
MSPHARVGELLIVRPLLQIRREQLCRFLTSIDQPWRTDVSNESPAYLRNRLRRLLSDRPELFDATMSLAQACRAVRDWARETAPVLPDRFPARLLADLPQILARESARRWLVQRGAAPDQTDVNVLERLIGMAEDAATPAAQHFPGRLLVRRRRGELFVG